MRFFFTGPRIMGIRPGISLSPKELIGGSSGRVPGQPAGCSFVYVVRGDHNMVKIGVTTNPDARLAQLRTGSAFPIDYAYLGITPGDGYDIEAAAHTMLSKRRCHGEWFDCDPQTAVMAVANAAYNLGQPITQVPPDQAAQALQMATRLQSQSQPQQSSVVNRFLWRVLYATIGALVMVIILIIIGNNVQPK